MLLQKINKKVSSEEEAYYVYLGILQAVSNFKIAEQEKRILSVILKNRGITKDVRKELQTIASKARIENVIGKLREKKILIGDKPNEKFPVISMQDTTFTITLKPVNETSRTEEPSNS